MRLAAAVPLGLFALTACVPPPNVPPGPRYPDLRIDVALVKDGNKCFVRFVDPKDKAKERAVAWTANAVIWSVVDNSCGELKKGQAKALGLRFIKARIGGKPPFWDRDRCSFLSFIPAKVQTPLDFRCDIPSRFDKEWAKEWDDVDHIEYDYEIDGDSVEPLDPGLDVKRNG